MVSMGIFGKEKIQLVLTCSVKKVFLEIWQNSQKNTCARTSFNKVAGFRPATLLKKETLAQMFFCEFCEISKNTFLYRTRLVAASERERISNHCPSQQSQQSSEALIRRCYSK